MPNIQLSISNRDEVMQRVHDAKAQQQAVKDRFDAAMQSLGLKETWGYRLTTPEGVKLRITCDYAGPAIHFDGPSSLSGVSDLGAVVSLVRRIRGDEGADR